MTNREAIDVLSQFACPGVPGVEKAINMAIDALKEKDYGTKWVAYLEKPL